MVDLTLPFLGRSVVKDGSADSTACSNSSTVQSVPFFRGQNRKEWVGALGHQVETVYDVLAGDDAGVPRSRS